MIEQFTAGTKVVVRAPAGCGKTHLLFQAVAHLGGRQLVLTHTNAGVKELHTRLEKEGVKPGSYNLKTIDSFAFSYVAAYPSASGVDVGIPSGEDWAEVKEGFLRLLGSPFVRQVISASYSGLVVDEYQDCSVAQHEIVLALSEILPTRVVGDPMQGIFDFNQGRGAQVNWDDVERDFTLIGELDEPHRWKGGNESLGNWIKTSRAKLEAGEKLASGTALTVHRNSNRQELVAHLHALIQQHPDDSIAVIFPKNRGSCWNLAGQLKNRYQVLEDADCIDLVRAAKLLDEHLAAADGADLLLKVCVLIDKHTAKLPAQFKGWARRIAANNPPTSRKPELARIIAAMVRITQSPDAASIKALFAECDSFNGLILRSKEIWTTFGKALTLSANDPTLSIEKAVRDLRHKERAAGRKPPFRCVSTTLLLKGMEFDRVVIPDYSEYRQLPKHLYVAISRPRKGLDIFLM